MFHYRDIADYMKLLEREQDGDIEDGDRLGYEIAFTRKPHAQAPNGGYLVLARPYEFDEVRLLAECVNSARFLSEKQAANLRYTLSGLCSSEQAKAINTDSQVVNRTKTVNKTVMASLSAINSAIRNKHQISFQYLTYSFDNLHTQIERRSGAKYVCNPYKLLIDNGFFYVLTYNENDKRHKAFPYRIDRMKNVRELDTPRQWEQEFAANVNMENYTQRVFSMFGGQRERVKIRFTDFKLDTVVDQFGINGVKYEKLDEKHFTAEAEVELSDMFFAWVCGFGRTAKILEPPQVVDKMRAFVEKIHGMYEPRE